MTRRLPRAPSDPLDTAGSLEPTGSTGPAEVAIAVVGAAGYTGAELVSLLLRHPSVRVTGLYRSERRGGDGTPERFEDLFPRHRGEIDLAVEPLSAEAAEAAAVIASRRIDAVFLATPHEASLEIAPALRREGAVVLDLSAAFRLRDRALYPRHYGFEHGDPASLDDAVYGLPELNAEAIAQPRANGIIACPGCYPTSVILPIAPLVQAGLLERGAPVIVDSASGVSGAGRSPALKSLFCEVSYAPYAVLDHRHAPEMAQECGAPILFTPHLLPLDRGILSTIHPTLARGATVEDLRRVLATRYAGCPFVRLLPPGSWPSIAAVAHTNYCDIALGADPSGRHAIIVSAIDNLLKGAAGQAVQAFNIRFGLPETLGLPIPAHGHGAPVGAAEGGS